MASALASARRAYATGTDAVERVACTGGLLALSLCGAPLSLASAAIGASSLARGTLLAQAAAAWRATLAERNGFLAFAVVDALFGLAFFCLWVLYREKSVLSLAAWLALIAATGSGGARCALRKAQRRARKLGC